MKKVDLTLMKNWLRFQSVYKKRERESDKGVEFFFFLIGIKNIIIIIKNVVLLEKVHSNIYIFKVNKNNNTTKTTCNLGIFYYLFISLW